MCPGTLAIASAVATAGSAVLGGVSSAEAANYQAKVASNNAVIARNNARYSASAGASQAEQQSLRDAQKLSGLRAAQGALGVDPNSGSAADVQVSQRELGGLDQATVSNNAALEVYGYKTQAQSFEAQSKLDESEVGYDIAGSLLSGVGKLAGNPAAASGFSSLMSGGPTVSDQYSWMQDGLTSNISSDAAAAGLG